MIINTKIVGSTYCRGQRLLPLLIVGDELELKRNPQNKFDKNAIEVHNQKAEMLGHIPREMAKLLAPLMDEGTETKTFVSNLSGGNGYHYKCELRIEYEMR